MDQFFIAEWNLLDDAVCFLSFIFNFPFDLCYGVICLFSGKLQMLALIHFRYRLIERILFFCEYNNENLQKDRFVQTMSINILCEG